VAERLKNVTKRLSKAAERLKNVTKRLRNAVKRLKKETKRLKKMNLLTVLGQKIVGRTPGFEMNL
jgi:chaperonin cofactor prefoldin